MEIDKLPELGKLLYKSSKLHITSYFYEEVILYYYSYILLYQKSNSIILLLRRGVPIWEFWVLPIPIIFLSKSTDTDH